MDSSTKVKGFEIMLHFYPKIFQFMVNYIHLFLIYCYLFSYAWPKECPPLPQIQNILIFKNKFWPNGCFFFIHLIPSWIIFLCIILYIDHQTPFHFYMFSMSLPCFRHKIQFFFCMYNNEHYIIYDRKCKIKYVTLWGPNRPICFTLTL